MRSESQQEDDDAVGLPDAGDEPDLGDALDGDDDRPAAGKGIDRDTPLGGI
jgi:hypothetical protein